MRVVAAVCVIVTNVQAESPPEPNLILRLWPAEAPGLIQPVASETTDTNLLYLRNVSVPEMWIYLPKQPGTNRPGIMVCPAAALVFWT